MVKCIETSTGGHSHTPRVISVKKYWEYVHIVKSNLGLQTYWAWETTATLRLLGGARGAGAPTGGGDGGAVAYRVATRTACYNRIIERYTTECQQESRDWPILHSLQLTSVYATVKEWTMQPAGRHRLINTAYYYFFYAPPLIGGGIKR